MMLKTKTENRFSKGEKEMINGEKEHNSKNQHLPIEDDQVETLVDAQENTLTDLSVNDWQAERTKGGMLLPAVQKVR